MDDEINENVFEGNEFVFTKSGDEFVGGGYKVDSIFMKNGISPITTFNQPNDVSSDVDEILKGGKVSSPFENLAVPAGLFYINQKIPKRDEKYINYENHKMLPDDIFDKLFSLVEVNKKPRKQTRKHTNKTSKKKTRRSK